MPTIDLKQGMKFRPAAPQPPIAALGWPSRWRLIPTTFKPLFRFFSAKFFALNQIHDNHDQGDYQKDVDKSP